MEGNQQIWNPHQFVPPQTGPYGVMGPLYHPATLPPPATIQPYQNCISQLSFPPPSLSSFCPPPPLPNPQSCNPTLESPVSSSESKALSLEAEDKKWMTTWLMEHNIDPIVKQESSSGAIRLMDIREDLLRCLSLIKELQKYHHEMSLCSDLSDATDWHTCLTAVQGKKADLTLLLAKLQSLDVPSIKRKLLKRAKKRDRLRRRRTRCKEVQLAVEARRKRLHERADAWLAEMRLTVERDHREEELRREADAVLGEVTRKQTEAKREISLLDALMKLRAARAERAAAHSSAQDVEADRSAKKFGTVIERLRKLWNVQLKEYAAEERGLRVMLQESAEQKSDARCQRVKSVVDQWRKAIFGDGGAGTQVQQNIDELIAVRQGWDRLVVPAGFPGPMASSIPVGWVLPHGPTSSSWRRFCVAYQKSD